MGEVETSSLGIVEIVLRVVVALFAVGALIGGAITLANVDDTYPDNDVTENFEFNISAELEDDEEGYRSQAVFVVFACSVAIIIQTVMTIVRGLYFGQIIAKRFLVFAIVNTVSSVLLTLSFVSSGVSSGTNAADVQDNIDRFRCEELDDVQIPAFSNQLAAYQDFCDNLEVLRDSMIASAACCLTGSLIFATLAVVMFVSVVMRCKQKST